MTDAEGRYLLPRLRIGRQSITVELSGFKRAINPDVDARIGQRLVIDFTLEVGGLSEVMTVSGSTMLQVATAEIFNALDRTNFDLPNRTFGTANFGRIFSAKAAREMQLGVRFGF